MYNRTGCVFVCLASPCELVFFYAGCICGLNGHEVSFCLRSFILMNFAMDVEVMLENLFCMYSHLQNNTGIGTTRFHIATTQISLLMVLFVWYSNTHLG